MSFLLDTHVFLWFETRSPRLSDEAAAVIDRAVSEAQRALQRTPLVLLTGGAAVQVEPLLQCSYVSVPDLVLRGLALRCGLAIK